MASFSSAVETDIEAEAVLDPRIKFPHPVSPYALSPHAVCLTGATGFLGAYLLREILTTTKADAYCIVRAKTASGAYDRLVSNLVGYDLWRPEYASRIRPVAVHDLADSQFGLANEEYNSLASTVDAIYHSAGSLNMAFPYARLKSTNVTGTLEVLRLAGAIRTKPVHFLSSMVVFFSEAHTSDPLLRETDAPLYHSTLKGGYGKSKWVADRLVWAAQQRGLPATIHRPVRTMGHSQSGAMNDLSDVLPMLIKGCILLGKCPAFDVKVTMVPVDVVTKCMVHLAGKPESAGGAFHYFHPEPVEWSRLMDFTCSLGYPMQTVSYEQWWREMKQRVADRSEPRELRQFFSTLLLVLTAPHFLFYKRPPLDASNLRKGLKGTGIDYPPIDETLMATYLAYWRKIGFVPGLPSN